MRVCTVINRAWVAHARALAESLSAHQPGATLSVLVVDPIEGFIDPAAEPFTILSPRDLQIPRFDAMSARYDVTALCCALKPTIMRHLLRDGGPVVYLDSDVRLLAPLDGLDEALDAHPFLLVPHLLEPLPADGLQPDELAILLGGSFNLGVAAARPDHDVDALLSWWADRLITGSRLDPSHAMVFDQRWADLMPGMFEVAGLWRDPGVNFGYWRAATSRLEHGESGVLVDGRPLRCMHFSGFDPKQPDRLSANDNRVHLDRHPVLRDLCSRFAERLRAHGHDESGRWPYAFAGTASGAPMTAELRELWDQASRAQAVDEPPFTPSGESEFLRWLAAPRPGEEGVPLGRYLRHLHDARDDLRERFADVNGADRAGYLAWADEQAEREPSGVLGLLRQRARSAREPGLRMLEPGQTLGVERGETVVCIPVYGAQALFAECLISVLGHTPLDVPLLIADDASPDPAIEAFVRSLADAGRLDARQVAYLRQPRNVGFPGNVNAAFAAAAPADVVVLNSDCVVAAGWFEGMRHAAYSDALVATASSLTNHGTILSVPHRNHPHPSLPQDQDLDTAAQTLRRQSLRLYPHLPTAVGHCMYVRRQALDLVGNFDLAFSPGYGEEVDFSQRCVLHGLVHVAADDVLVLHHSGGSFNEDGLVNSVRDEHEAIIDARYPYYGRAQTEAGRAELGPLPRALASARRAMRGLAVTIDARCLGPLVTGTQVHTLEVIAALSHTDRLSIRVIVPPDLGAYAQARLAELDRVELLAHSDIHAGTARTDVAHRPFQVSSADDLRLLSRVGERTVITHQDLIAYRNPGYFPGFPQWERHRRLTRQALASADGVVFFSHHAANDALREELVERERVRVVYIGVDHGQGVGVDHGQGAGPGARDMPPGMDALGERQMLLCLGTDFRHKNRVFALRMLEALRAAHGWDGVLVLAGPRVSHGSSAGEEAAYLATRPELAASVIQLPAITEAHKEWLLERCAAVLYPTTYEGFGLMPFEAATYDRPCLFASQTALAETLPAETAVLTPWDPAVSAERAHRLLSDPRAAAAHVRAIRAAGERFTWRSTGESLVDVYWATAASPARVASRMANDLALVELEREDAERKYNELWQALTPDTRALLAPGGPLDTDTKHSLAAIARRPLLRRMLFSPLRFAHRLSGGRAGRAVEDEPAAADIVALHFGYSNNEHMREQLARGAAADLPQDP